MRADRARSSGARRRWGSDRLWIPRTATSPRYARGPVAGRQAADRRRSYQRHGRTVRAAGRRKRPGLSVCLSQVFAGLPRTSFEDLEFDGTGQRFVAIATNGSVHIQNVATPDQAITLNQYQDTAVDAAISPDGSLVAVAETNGQIRFHSTEDGSELTDFRRTAKSASTSPSTRPASVCAPRHRDKALVRSISIPILCGPSAAPPSDRAFSWMSLATASSLMAIAISCATATPDSASSTSTAARIRRPPAGSGQRNGMGQQPRRQPHRHARRTRQHLAFPRRGLRRRDNGPMPAMTDNAMRLSADGRTLIVGGRTRRTLPRAARPRSPAKPDTGLRRLDLPAPALQYEISPGRHFDRHGGGRRHGRDKRSDLRFTTRRIGGPGTDRRRRTGVDAGGSP